jgi:ABC-type dipeptide/oligopeptide/nickel transport system permease component
MLARLFNRIIWSAVTLLGTAVLTFLLVNAVPGDVARVIAGSKASPKCSANPRAPSSERSDVETFWAIT